MCASIEFIYVHCVEMKKLHEADSSFNKSLHSLTFINTLFISVVYYISFLHLSSVNSFVFFAIFVPYENANECCSFGVAWLDYLIIWHRAQYLFFDSLR